MDRITTTIKRCFLAEIVAETKKVEYRDFKPYWQHRFDGISLPFELRLINGMSKRAPEATVLITRIEFGNHQDHVGPVYALHIGKVLNTKNCRGLVKACKSRA